MKTILTADIGGTNSRFGHFRMDENQGLELVIEVIHPLQWGFDPTILYKFSGKLKGLSVGNALGLRVSANEPHNPLVENRFRLIYEF
jgi:hypothetical protein